MIGGYIAHYGLRCHCPLLSNIPPDEENPAPLPQEDNAINNNYQIMPPA